MESSNRWNVGNTDKGQFFSSIEEAKALLRDYCDLGPSTRNESNSQKAKQ